MFPKPFGEFPKPLGELPKTLGVFPKTLGVFPKNLGVFPKTLGELPIFQKWAVAQSGLCPFIFLVLWGIIVLEVLYE